MCVCVFKVCSRLCVCLCVCLCCVCCVVCVVLCLCVVFVVLLVWWVSSRFVRLSPAPPPSPLRRTTLPLDRPSPPGLHTTAQEPKRAHLSAPALQTPPKFNERTLKSQDPTGTSVKSPTRAYGSVVGCTFEGPGLKNHQNSTKRPPREEERMKIVAGERKSAKFRALDPAGLHTFGAPHLQGPGPHTFGATPSGPHH